MITHRTYQRHALAFQIVLWGAFLALQLAINIWVAWSDVRNLQASFALWEVVTWETSSTIVIACLIPLVAWLHQRLQLAGWRRALATHLLATLPFSLAHVLAMVAIRELVYASQGAQYDFAPWAPALFYEYLKDFRTYFAIVLVVELFGLFTRRWQGEAKVVETQTSTAPAPIPGDRFLVKTLGREYLITIEDIDWIEASGNYVTLHVGKRLYPMRTTMKAMADRLANHGFARIHRSHLVNMNRVVEIVPCETGEATVKLSTGQTLTASRRYRSSLKAALV